MDVLWRGDIQLLCIHTHPCATSIPRGFQGKPCQKWQFYVNQGPLFDGNPPPVYDFLVEVRGLPTTGLKARKGQARPRATRGTPPKAEGVTFAATA
jgi:hypothetical protein